MKRISLEQKQEIVRLVTEENRTVRDAARRVGVSESSAGNVMQRYRLLGEVGVFDPTQPPRRARSLEEKKAVVNSVVISGLSIRQAALMYGVGFETARTWVKDYVDGGGHALEKKTKIQLEDLKIFDFSNLTREEAIEKLKIEMAENAVLRRNVEILKKAKALVRKKGRK